MRARLAVGSVLAVLVVVVGAASSPAASRGVGGPDREVPSSVEREEAFDALAAEAGSRGTVRVFVELAVPTVPEGELSERRVEGQRDAIEAAADAVLEGLGEDGVEVRRTYGSIPFLSLELTRAALERLEGRPEVAMVAEVGTAELAGSGGPAPVVGAPGPILAPEAWARGADGTGQLVAIIDTGMDSSSTVHPDLAARVTHEACFSSDDFCPNEEGFDEGEGAALQCEEFEPTCYHGTAVASMVSATAPGADLFPITIVGALGTPATITWSWDDVAAALEYLVTVETEVPLAAVNMSLIGYPEGGYIGPDCDGEVEWAAIEAAVANLVSDGVAVVAAAGNKGKTTKIAGPACLSEVVAVGATDESHQSHAGYSDSAEAVTLWAPGGFGPADVAEPEPSWSSEAAICPGPVTWGLLAHGVSEGYPFCRVAGTSFASPHVAGAYAVVVQALGDAGASGDHLELATDLLVDNGVPYTDPRNSVTRPRLMVGPAVREVVGGWGAFQLSSPDRIVDTALGVGTCDGVACAAIAANGVPVEIQVADEGGVPEEVSAVALRVTARSSLGPGALAVNQVSGDEFDAVLGYDASRPSHTTAVAAVDEEGAVEVTAFFGGTVEVQVDVLGWYETVEGSSEVGFVPVEPAPLLDTAWGWGTCDPSPCARLVAEEPVAVQVAGEGGVPVSGVEAVVVSVVARSAADDGLVAVAEDDTAVPHGLLAVAEDRNASQTVVLPLAGDGTVTVVSDVAVDVTLDVVGWFGEGGGRHRPRSPALVMLAGEEVGDCLPSPCGPLVDSAEVRVRVAGIDGIPSRVGAVVLQVMAGTTSGPAEVSIYSGSEGMAAGLSLTVGLGEVQHMMVVARPDEDGYVTLVSFGDPVDIAVVVTGTFSPPA